MNESLDPLESELSALQPREMSGELRRAIAERLAEVERVAGAQRVQNRWLRRSVFVGGLIAASLAVILFRWIGNQPELTPGGPHPPTPSIAAENSNDTLLAYERALARSPDEFAALLDKDAAAGPAANHQFTRIRVSSWSNPELHALLGED
jgi:hypothetical protein